MQTGSQLLLLSQLIEEIQGKKVIIPLLQRNYKWGVENNDDGNNPTAEKLWNDILDAKKAGKNEYTIGMVTFYSEKDENSKDVVQVIDGQQRLITLSLLAKALGKYEVFPKISFGRDTDGKERENFLCSDLDSVSVDVRHMSAAYDMFSKKLKEYDKVKKDELYTWILEHIKLICRYTENEPLQEFLNLNEKKIPFSSTDYDRAYQLKHCAEQQTITPDMVIKKHNQIEKYLYTNESIFELIKKRYEDYANRMDLIFLRIKGNMKYLSECYDQIDILEAKDRDEKYKKCYEYLEYCHNVFRSIKQELEERNNSSLNVNIYNSVMMLYHIDPDFKFFDLIDIDDMDSETFEKRIQNRFNLFANTYEKNPRKNAFMQSQLLDEIGKDENQMFNIPKAAYQEETEYVSEDILNIFEEKIKETEDIIEKGKKFTELVKGGKKSFAEILRTPEINQIIVPTIQRDYTFGCRKEAVEGLLLDISKASLSSSIKGRKEQDYQKGSTARVVYNSLASCKLWPEPFYYNGSWWNNSDIKKKSWWEFDNKLGGLCKAAGINIQDEISSWGYNNEKVQLVRLIKSVYKDLELGENDFIDIKANRSKFFEETGNEEFLFSVIFGFLDDGNFYLYDGQQRIVTLVYLCAYLINKAYPKADSELKKRLDEYRGLLSKFKFEERKEANDLLCCLLKTNETIESPDELSCYVIDHSTYSIVKMLKTYEEYKNGYGKGIMSFDIDYLMEKVVFEFAVVQEASIADQMYMDLNSKNAPLTIYENYKAELVYILSTRFKSLYEKSWKYKLDNSFLDKCYLVSEGWEKSKADEAEEKEITIIHWCFKMACMEFGVSIGEIANARERLQWMEEPFAEEAIEIAGEILNKKIFTNDAKPKDIDDIINCVKSLVETEKIKEFSQGEFMAWHYLRFDKIKVKANNDKFVYTDSYIRVYNLKKDKAESLASYWIFLANKKDGNDEKAKSDTIKFMLGKYHNYWSNGYLQAELLSSFEGFYPTKDNEDVLKYSNKIKCVSDYYSDKYLCDKPDSIKWCEYIYTIKIKEMLDIKQYELIKIWEDAENERQKEFEPEVKKRAKKHAFGDYKLWNHIENKFNQVAIGDISFNINTGSDIKNNVIEKLTIDDYINSRIRKIILEKDTPVTINAEYSCNPDIMDLVTEYLVKNMPPEFKEKIKEKYYIKEGDNYSIKLFEHKDDKKCWEEVSEITIDCFTIDLSRFSDDSIAEIARLENTDRNAVVFELWGYENGIISYDEYKQKTKVKNYYDLAIKHLGPEEVSSFKKTYIALHGYLPYN